VALSLLWGKLLCSVESVCVPVLFGDTSVLSQNFTWHCLDDSGEVFDLSGVSFEDGAPYLLHCGCAIVAKKLDEHDRLIHLRHADAF